MLVVGSSLMVYSGYRFAQNANLTGKPIAAVDTSRTRADDLLTLKIVQPCAAALSFLSNPPRPQEPVRVIGAVARAALMGSLT